MKFPDTKGCISIGLFVMAQEIFALIAWKPDLQENKLFSTLAVLILGSGGLLMVIGFYFGSSAGSASKDSTINNLSQSIPTSPAPVSDPPATSIPLKD